MVGKDERTVGSLELKRQRLERQRLERRREHQLEGQESPAGREILQPFSGAHER